MAGARWWGGAVAACSSVAALAGLVSLTATAVDGSATVPVAATAPAPPPPTTAPVDPLAGRPRAGEPVLAATLALPPGWRDVATQRVVPVVAGRYDTVLTAGDRAVLLVGRTGAGGGGAGASRAAVADVARRLTGGPPRSVVVADAPRRLDGRTAWSTSWRIAPGPGRGGGALLSATTVATARGRPALVVLAVVLAGPDQVARARDADAAVASLRSG